MLPNSTGRSRTIHERPFQNSGSKEEPKVRSKKTLVSKDTPEVCLIWIISVNSYNTTDIYCLKYTYKQNLPKNPIRLNSSTKSQGEIRKCGFVEQWDCPHSAPAIPVKTSGSKQGAALKPVQFPSKPDKRTGSKTYLKSSQVDNLWIIFRIPEWFWMHNWLERQGGSNDRSAKT